MQYGGIGFITGSSVSDDVDLIMNNQHNNHNPRHRSSNHRRSNPPGTEQDPNEAHNNRNPAPPSSSSCFSMRPRPVAAGTGGAVPITVDEAIDRLGMWLFQYQIVLACGTLRSHHFLFFVFSWFPGRCFVQLLPPISINIPNDLACDSIYLYIYLAYLFLSFLLQLL